MNDEPFSCGCTRRMCTYCRTKLPRERGCQHGASMFCDEDCEKMNSRLKEQPQRGGPVGRGGRSTDSTDITYNGSHY